MFIKLLLKINKYEKALLALAALMSIPTYFATSAMFWYIFNEHYANSWESLAVIGYMFTISSLLYLTYGIVLKLNWRKFSKTIIFLTAIPFTLMFISIVFAFKNNIPF